MKLYREGWILSCSHKSVELWMKNSMLSYLLLPRPTSNTSLSLLTTTTCFFPINFAYPTVKKCSDFYYLKVGSSKSINSHSSESYLKAFYLSVCNFDVKNLLCLCFADWGLFDLPLGLWTENKIVFSSRNAVCVCAQWSKHLKHFSLNVTLMGKQTSFKHADSRIWQINEVNYKHKNLLCKRRVLILKLNEYLITSTHFGTTLIETQHTWKWVTNVKYCIRFQKRS
jgi:hypothetical protein